MSINDEGTKRQNRIVLFALAYDDDVNKTITFEPLNRSIENIEAGKTYQ